MTPQSDQVSRQREREAFEREAYNHGWRNFTRDEHSGRYVVQGDLELRWIGWSWRAALALPSETPVGHQIERDGKESGAVGGEPKGIGEASSDEMWATIERLGAADRFS